MYLRVQKILFPVYQNCFQSCSDFAYVSKRRRNISVALFWQKHAINSFALQYGLISSFVELHHL